MNTQAQILNTVIPLIIAVLAILPFIFIRDLGLKDKDIKILTYNSIFCYLICLGFAIIGLITIEAALVMGFHSATRAIFISAILLAACLDKVIDLIPQMVFIKTNLLKRLAYFVNILCGVPLIWQILIATIPKPLADNQQLMGIIQILLMLILLILILVCHPSKKKILNQNS